MSDLSVEEQQNVVKFKKVYENAVSLSNIIALSSAVVLGLSGGNVADAVNGQPVTRAVLSNMIANRIKEKCLTA